MSPTSRCADPQPFADTLGQAYAALPRLWEGNTWLQDVATRAQVLLDEHPHGDLSAWQEALRSLPAVDCAMDANRAAPCLGKGAADPQHLREVLMRLHPWRKGPLELGGVLIDTEWRSDWKWQRIQPHLDLEAQRVLDIGCGNGYFGWRMLAAGARLVVGVDPTLVYVMQWLACRHFAGNAPNFVLPLGIEHLPPGPAGFDCVFSMGVLYHRRDPVEHLEQIRALLRPDGALVLETLVLPDEKHGPVLVPESRYARMRNVWAIPTIDRLLAWLREAGFKTSQLVDVTATTVQEQRSTQWMRFDSLAEALHPKDARQTVEGYPAPTRALLIARC